MKARCIALIPIVISLVTISNCQAVSADFDADDWQMRRLMSPSESEVQAESAGQVMIYDGLTDKQISSALDQHFNRIDAMMFTSVIITDSSGLPKQDPLTGEILIEQDGCD
ncbi:MAG: hypothetical protein KUF74_02905 [Candidatus Thiodiazotropha sp. (ex Ctena orbiculata)]|nr:hypothetical protein [Candidatus Thiodiazotropha taylori]